MWTQDREQQTTPFSVRSKASKSRPLTQGQTPEADETVKPSPTQGLEQPFPQQPNIKEERKELKCPSCKRNHWLSQCDEFKKLSLSNRYQFVRVNKLCVNCLVPGHFVQDCSKRSFCRIQGCTKKHSTYLHVKEMPPSQNEKEGQTKPPPATPSAAQVSNSYLNSRNQRLCGRTINRSRKGQSKRQQQESANVRIFRFRLKNSAPKGRKRLSP